MEHNFTCDKTHGVSFEQEAPPKTWKLYSKKQVLKVLPYTVSLVKCTYTVFARLGGWKATEQTGNALIKV
ncbi:hypothetical protein AltI4_29380 [Alteromonas sp. I4]|nr:hypothetical protein AltI4_29380 [Alteromonas sp. I4]